MAAARRMAQAVHSACDNGGQGTRTHFRQTHPQRHTGRSRKDGHRLGTHQPATTNVSALPGDENPCRQGHARPSPYRFAGQAHHDAQHQGSGAGLYAGLQG